MTNGCFDILHPGHVSYLENARKLGDRLIVAVNTDGSVKRLKGESRPINNLNARMAVLAGLASVDWVVSFDEDTPQRLIGEILPDLLVKGGDYKPEEIAGSKEVWANGGDVISTDGKENLLNSQENIDTLTWLQDMVVNEGVSPEGLTGADADTLFQAGQLAMYMSGPWNINGLNQLGVNYGITAIPAGSAGAFSPEGGCAYMLTKGADDATRAAVYKFMAYWLSDATLKEWSNRNGFPVWSYSVLEDEDIKANEILSNVSKASEIGRDWHLNLTIGSQIDSDVMQPMIEKIFSGEDVAENVKAASDILDGIIAAQ